MREEDEKALLTAATLAVGALVAYGAFKSVSDRVKKKHVEDMKVLNLPVIHSDIEFEGTKYTVYVNPYDIGNTELKRKRRRVIPDKYETYTDYVTETRKCTNRELKEIYEKCLWCTDWKTGDGRPVVNYTRSKVLAMMEEYVKRR